MSPDKLGFAALSAILEGADMTLHIPHKEKWPTGWPRGELLSVNDMGKNYSFNPVKVLAFMHKIAKLSNGHSRNSTP